MEYADSARDQPYVVGTVQPLPGIGWALLHCAKKTVMHENSPAGVDLGTVAYMRAEAVPTYVVYIADSGRWLVAKLEQLEAGSRDTELQRKGVIFGSGVEFGTGCTCRGRHGSTFRTRRGGRR